MERVLDIGLASDQDLDAAVGLLARQLEEHDLTQTFPRLREAVAAVLRDRSLGFIVAARQGAMLVGCACVSFVWSMEHAGRAAWLEEMYVIPEQRGAGIGTALLAEALSRSLAAGCTAMDLEVDASHARAERLYERRNFARLGRTRWVKKLDGIADQAATDRNPG